MVNRSFLPRTFDFENVNAARDAAIIDKNVETIAINRLLKIYLEIGIRKLLNREGKALKLLNVGRATKNLGGNIRSSSNGFKDVATQ